MRSTRILTAAALTASALVLSAGAAGAQTVPNPDLRSFPTGPACASKTFTGEVRAVVDAKTLPDRASIVVQLRWNNGGSAYEDTAVAGTQVIYPQAGAGTYGFSISTSAVPSSAKNLMAYAIAKAGSTTTDTLASKTLLASYCASETAATTTVSSVSIDCSGDLVSGSAALADPPTSGTIPGTVALQGRSAGTTIWTALGNKSYTVGATTTSLPYDFSIAGKHMDEYRTLARVNNGTAVFSPIIGDTACAPAEVVPEAPVAALVPLTLAATAGAVVVVRRRRTAASATSA